MYFSRKNILTKGKKPLSAVSRVINASCGSASTTFARCWVHSTNKTSALFKTVKNQGFRRAYSTKNGADGQGTGNGGLQAGLGLPFYRMTIITFPLVRGVDARVKEKLLMLGRRHRLSGTRYHWLLGRCSSLPSNIGKRSSGHDKKSNSTRTGWKLSDSRDLGM